MSDERDSHTKLDETVAIVLAAHGGHTGKTGRPTVAHALAVWHRVCDMDGTDDDIQTAALLHDIVEDSSWSVESLRLSGYNETVLEIIDRVTQRAGETYMDSIRRVMGHPGSILVKLADLDDHLDPLSARGLEGTDLRKHYIAARHLITRAREWHEARTLSKPKL